MLFRLRCGLAPSGPKSVGIAVARHFEPRSGASSNRAATVLRQSWVRAFRRAVRGHRKLPCRALSDLVERETPENDAVFEDGHEQVVGSFAFDGGQLAFALDE